MGSEKQLKRAVFDPVVLALPNFLGRARSFRELELRQIHPLQLAWDQGASNAHSKETETRAFLEIH